MHSTRRSKKSALRGFEPFIGLAFIIGSCLLTAMFFPEGPRGPRYMGAGNTTPRSGGTMVFHHESDVRGLDPLVSYDELVAVGLKLVFDGLLDYDRDLHLIPRLAVRMPEQSPDGKLFRFELRRGVHFHNGRELTADDVSWSMHHMLDPDVGSPGFPFYMQIAGVEDYRAKKAKTISGIRVLDRYRIEFALAAPDQTFLNAMALPFSYPVPKENYAAHPLDVALHPVGTGPFIFEQWEPGIRITFRRNPNYWRPGEAHPDKMVYEVNLAREPAFLRFRNGELDHVHRIAIADRLFLEHAKEWEPYRHAYRMLDIWGLTMNCQMAPFDNVHIRRAVAFAIDRERWARTRAYVLAPTGQFLPEGFIGYDANLPEGQKYDLAKAKEEMRLAGVPNGLKDPVTVWMVDGVVMQVYSELIRQDLAKIGIQVKPKYVSFPLYMDATGRPHTAQMQWGGWFADFPDPSNFFDMNLHSRAITQADSQNKSFYSNPEFDSLIDRAKVETDPAKRADLYHQANNLIAHDAPWAFVFNTNWLEAWQPYVKNYYPYRVWMEMYRDVWLDLPRRRADALFGALNTGSSSFTFASLFPFWSSK